MTDTLRDFLALFGGFVLRSLMLGDRDTFTKWINGIVFDSPARRAMPPPPISEAALRTTPPGRWVILLAIMVGSALVGGLLAGWFSAKPRPVALAFAALMLAASAFTAFATWHPWWFQAGALALPALLGWAGTRIAGYREPPPTRRSR